MPRKRHTPEQIIDKRRQAEVELSEGKTVPQACKKIGVAEQTYYRWHHEYGKLRDELLDREVFDTLLEAKVLMERWRKGYNHFRPHSTLGYCPPAPASFASPFWVSAVPRRHRGSGG